MIQYVHEPETDVITAKACIWERAANFVKVLKSYIDEYGDLSTCVFKIKRHGAKGDMQTTYDLVLANPNIYKDSIYVKDFSAFEEFKLSDYIVLEKTAKEMSELLTGTEKENTVVESGLEDNEDHSSEFTRHSSDIKPDEKSEDNRPTRRYKY